MLRSVLRQQRPIFYDVKDDFGGLKLEHIDLLIDSSSTQSYQINENDPLSALANYTFRFEYESGLWSVGVKGELTMTCSEKEFKLNGHTTAIHNKKILFEKSLDIKIPRDGF